MFYYIVITIILIFIAYAFGLTIITIFDRHLKNIEVITTRNNMLNENFENKYNENKYNQNNKNYDNEEEEKEDLEKNLEEKLDVEEFNNFTSKYILNKECLDGWMMPTIPKEKYNICINNHLHNKCERGKMNYPDPNQMSPIDKRYFKYNFQQNMTLQDYINWLWLYQNDTHNLSYENLKNLLKLKKGQYITYIPTTAKTVPRNTQDYFNNVYQGINIRDTFNTDKSFYPGFNYNYYPTPSINFIK